MKTFLLLIAILSLANAVSANVLIVNNNPNAPQGHYSNFQTAVDAAMPGDTLYIVGSPKSYSENAVWYYISKKLTIIGTGYNPQKDSNYIAMLNTTIILNGSSTGTKFIGISGFVIDGGGIDSIEIRDCYFRSPGAVSCVSVHSYANIYHNIFDVPGGGAGGVYCSGSDNKIYNNLFSSNINAAAIADANPGNNGSIIQNNLILGTSTYAFREWGVQNYIIENNIFFYCSPHCWGPDVENSIYNNNLSFQTPNDSFIFGTNTGSNNLVSTDPLFDSVPSPRIDFSFDYHLQPYSPAKNAGTDGTDIGLYGGANPFKEFIGYPGIPQVISLNVVGYVIGQNDSIPLYVKAIANTNAPIVAAEYFIDTDFSNGNNIPIKINSSDSLSFSLNLPNGLELGNHIVGIRFKNANGVWSLPEIRTFNVCIVSGPISNFNTYSSGYNIIFEDLSKNRIDRYHWNFGDGDTSNLSDPVHSYDSAGYYEVKLTTYNSCNIEGNSILKNITVNGINSIAPNYGGNSGTVTIYINGAGFNDSAVVKLKRNGFSDIIAIDSTTKSYEGGKLVTTFDLTDAVTGFWDIEIILPNDTTFFIESGFEIQTGKKGEIDVKVICPEFVRASGAISSLYSFTITYTNTGNNDIVRPIYTLISADGIPIGFTKDQLSRNYSTLPLYLVNPEFNIAYETTDSSISLENERLSPGITNSITVWAKAGKIVNTTEHFTLMPIKKAKETIAAWNGVCNVVPDLIFTQACQNHDDCYDRCGSDLQQCDLDFYNDLINACNQYIFPNNLVCWETAAAYYSGVRLLGWIFYNLAQDKCIDRPPRIPLGPWKGILICPTCFGPKTIASLDPNKKVGASNISGSIYHRSDNSFDYSIYFENSDSASASVQNIVIIDTLDKINLDLNTFQLGNINFGDIVLNVPSGIKYYTTDIDLRPETPLIVRVTAYLNDSNGIATWSFNSLDTLTLEPITDPLLGFLPPNDSLGRGQGNLIFTLKAKNNLQTGSIIKNNAEIYFDYNTPIVTPDWTYIIDDLKPTSKVDSLPTITYSDSIKVNWLGLDAGPAGIYAYNVYYKVNDGDWILWKYNTSETSEIFIGKKDSTYGFYTVAIDSALNIESAPDTADATTTISSEVLPLTLISFGASCSENTVSLNWTIANESGVKHFTVEKCIDAVNWISSKIITPANNSQIQNQYNSSDTYNGYNYYRLHITDNDGKVSYSSVMKINCGKYVNSLQAYPVPAKNILNVIIQTDKAAGITIMLTDLHGRTIKKINQNIREGVNNFSLNTSDIANGQYFLKADGIQGLKTQKIIIIH